MHTTVLARYDDLLLGLPYPVTLYNIAEQISHAKSDAVIGVAVPDAEGLARKLAYAMCKFPVHLIGAEIRFMRKAVAASLDVLAYAADTFIARLDNLETMTLNLAYDEDVAIRRAVLGLLGITREEFTLPSMLLSRADIECHGIEVSRSDPDTRDDFLAGWDITAVFHWHL
jgi:hypothetical protein